MHKSVVLFSPGRFSYTALDLARCHDKFLHSLLPDAVTLANVYVCERPENWR